MAGVAGGNMQMILAEAKSSTGPETQGVFLHHQGLMVKQSLPLTHKEAESQECRSHAQKSEGSRLER